MPRFTFHISDEDENALRLIAAKKTLESGVRCTPSSLIRNAIVQLIATEPVEDAESVCKRLKEMRDKMIDGEGVINK